MAAPEKKGIREFIVIQEFPRFMSPRTASVYLDISLSNLNDLLKRGLIPVMKIPKGNGRLSRPRIDRQDLDDFMLRYKSSPEEPEEEDVIRKFRTKLIMDSQG